MDCAAALHASVPAAWAACLTGAPTPKAFGSEQGTVPCPAAQPSPPASPGPARTVRDPVSPARRPGGHRSDRPAGPRELTVCSRDEACQGTEARSPRGAGGPGPAEDMRSAEPLSKGAGPRRGVSARRGLCRRRRSKVTRSRGPSRAGSPGRLTEGRPQLGTLRPSPAGCSCGRGRGGRRGPRGWTSCVRDLAPPFRPQALPPQPSASGSARLLGTGERTLSPAGPGQTLSWKAPRGERGALTQPLGSRTRPRGEAGEGPISGAARSASPARPVGGACP